MSTYDFRAIIAEVNLRAKAHPIDELQKIRKRLKGLSRFPGRDLFAKATTFDEWAFHLGGLAELQFNIGVERLGDGDVLRSGVAFSFQPNQALPDVRVLYPKVWLFNDFIELNPAVCADMRMWHWTKKAGRSDPRVPRAIPVELMTEGVFVFLGKRHFNRPACNPQARRCPPAPPRSREAVQVMKTRISQRLLAEDLNLAVLSPSPESLHFHQVLGLTK